MNENEIKTAWKEARPMSEWIQKNRSEGRVPKWTDLTFIDLTCAAYGDWLLYRDTDGTYYYDYNSIGD